MYFKNLNKSFLRGFSSPLSLFQQKRKRREDVVWHIIYIFYCSPKGDKPKDHQNSASMYGTNHCRLEHVRAEAFSTCWSQKSQNNSRHLTSFHNLQGISQNTWIKRKKKKASAALSSRRKERLEVVLCFSTLFSVQAPESRAQYEMSSGKVACKKYAGATSRQQKAQLSAGDIKSLTCSHISLQQLFHLLINKFPTPKMPGSPKLKSNCLAPISDYLREVECHPPLTLAAMQ